MKFAQKKKRPSIEFNTSALPDIIFMLLFFFMVVTVIRKDKKLEKYELPEVDYVELLKAKDQLVIGLSVIDDQLSYLVGSKKYRNIIAFEKALTQQDWSKNKNRVKLVADKNIQIRHINEVKRVLQKLQLYKVDYQVKKLG